MLVHIRVPQDDRRFAFGLALPACSVPHFPSQICHSAVTSSFKHHLPDGTLSNNIRYQKSCIFIGSDLFIEIISSWPACPCRKSKSRTFQISLPTQTEQNEGAEDYHLFKSLINAHNFTQLKARASWVHSNPAQLSLLEHVSSRPVWFGWADSKWKICPHTVTCCSRVPKSIPGVPLVATARFLWGPKRILSLQVPLMRLDEFIWADDLIRTQSRFSPALSLTALLSFISSVRIFLYCLIGTFKWIRWHRPSLGPSKEETAMLRNAASRYFRAHKQVRITAGTRLFTHCRGHQRLREANVIYMFYHSNDKNCNCVCVCI